MGELLHAKLDWKYLINLCGQDFPIGTNLELVRYLKLLQPKNAILSKSLDHASKQKLGWISPVAAHSAAEQNPLGISLEKHLRSGNAYNFFSRQFIQWIFEDEKVQKFIVWEEMKRSYTPDEFVWAILQSLPDAPGGVKEPNEENVARALTWKRNNNICRGPRWRHKICIYGLLDLPFLIQSDLLFANKFDDDPDDLVLQCLEIVLRKRQLNNL